MYVSYDFYKQTFGDTIPEADFSKVEAKAEAVIGYLTYINGDIFAKEDNRVKLAVVAPLAGAWIEILLCTKSMGSHWSLPSREHGLKL